MAEPRYTVVIQWSEEDECYVASLPEWGPYCKAYGESYEEAARQAHEVLDLLLEPSPEVLRPPPSPKLFHYPGADVIDLPPIEDKDDSSSRRVETPSRQTA